MKTKQIKRKYKHTFTMEEDGVKGTYESNEKDREIVRLRHLNKRG